MVKPISSRICHPWVIAFNLFLAVFLSIDSATTLHILSKGYGMMAFDSFRIVGVDKNGLDFPNCSALQYVTVRLLTNECEMLSPSPSRFYLDDITATTPRFYPEYITFNGFKVENAALAAADLLRFQGSNDKGQTWETVGSSNMLFLPSGIRLLTTEVLLTNEKQTIIDRRPPWPLFVGAAKGLMAAALLLVMAVCAFYALAILARRALLVCIVLVAACDLTAAAGYCTLGLQREGFLPAVRATVTFAVAATVHSSEPLAPLAALIAAMCELAGRIANDCTIFHDCGRLASSPPVIAVAIVAAAIAVLSARARIFAAAAAGVEQDLARYDNAWAALCADPAYRLEIAVLEAAACNFPSALPSGPLRHFAGQTVATGSFIVGQDWQSAALLGSGPDRPGTAQAVESLDQLYTQALALDRHLHALCKDWADASSGAAVLGGDGPGAGLKPVDSSLRKAAARYGGDPARVVDICRRRIAVDRPAAAAACLRAVAQDPRARILRVRNGICSSYDARRTAGFRV